MFSKCSLNVQAVLDTNKGGHCTRLDIYNAVDDMAAVLQMPRTWIYDELKAALTRLSTTIMHSRRTAVRAFDSIWTRTLPRPRGRQSRWLTFKFFLVPQFPTCSLNPPRMFPESHQVHAFDSMDTDLDAFP